MGGGRGFYRRSREGEVAGNGEREGIGEEGLGKVLKKGKGKGVWEEKG